LQIRILEKKNIQLGSVIMSTLIVLVNPFLQITLNDPSGDVEKEDDGTKLANPCCVFQAAYNCPKGKKRM